MSGESMCVCMYAYQGAYMCVKMYMYVPWHYPIASHKMDW